LTRQLSQNTNNQLINFATKDIAVSYIVWDGLVFGEGPAKGTVQSGYLTIVSQRTKSGWKIISATNALNFRGLKNFDLKTLYWQIITQLWIPIVLRQPTCGLLPALHRVGFAAK
jgi:hypothetical protein